MMKHFYPDESCLFQDVNIPEGMGSHRKHENNLISIQLNTSGRFWTKIIIKTPAEELSCGRMVFFPLIQFQIFVVFVPNLSILTKTLDGFFFGILRLAKFHFHTVLSGGNSKYVFSLVHLFLLVYQRFLIIIFFKKKQK